MTEVLPCTGVEQGTSSHTNNALSRNVDGQSLLTPEDRKGNSIYYSPPGRKRDFLPTLFRRHKKRKVVQLGKQSDDDGLGEKRGTMMVVSVLIATLTYQASLNPPGGFWQDDKVETPAGDKHDAGSAINRHAHYFQWFLMANMVALFTSLVIILLLTSAITIKRRLMMWVLMIIMWISLFSVAFSFLFGVRLMLNGPSNTEVYYLVSFMLGCMGLIGILVLLHVFISLKGIYRRLKQKLQSHRQNIDPVSSYPPR